MSQTHVETARFRHREILLTTGLLVSAGVIGVLAGEPLAQGVETLFDGLMERGRQVFDSHYALQRS